MRLRVAASTLALSAAIAARLLAAGAPAAPKIPVTDEYHGVKVVDEYRWLEAWDDPRVRSWSDAQNEHARSVLDRLPAVAAIRARVTELRSLRIPRYRSLRFEGGTLFALLEEPPKQQRVLVAMTSADDAASRRVVVDPTVLDPHGGTAIDWYVPSPDGRRVAVSLSEGGSERGNLHVFDVATGERLGEVVPRVNYGTALGSACWDADGTGFYYTRYPRAGERPPADMDFYVQVYHHRLGSPLETDRYEIGKDFPRIAEIMLERSPDGAHVLANVQNGDSGEFAQYLRASDGRWTQLTRFPDQVVDAVFAPDAALYLLSRAGAPRGKVLRLSLREAGAAPSVDQAAVVPEGEGVIQFEFFGPHSIVPTATRLFLIEGLGGPQRVRVLDLAGRETATLPMPAVGSVRQVVPLPEPGKDAVLYETSSFVDPPTWWRWLPGPDGAGQPAKTGLTQAFPVSFDGVEVVREWAVSKDGTRVPMSILRPKGLKLDGRNPALLTGYGGYGSSIMPGFDPGVRIWLDAGGVIAIANLRGGAEFGEEWHRAGNLTRKQNVFDDFIACAEQLIGSGHTSKDRLAIQGGSNGGLLVGAALTQRPDLFRAVVSHVGVYDMLRSELSPNGAFNVPEYGTVKDPEQFRALHAYSPYHHVVDGTPYPAILFLTGANDARVDPMHSRKMTARLQAAGANVLLRTSGSTGHGGGTPLAERIEQEVDVYAFLFERLGMELPPARPPGAAGSDSP